jgi:hypothetical protein
MSWAILRIGVPGKKKITKQIQSLTLRYCQFEQDVTHRFQPRRVSTGLNRASKREAANIPRRSEKNETSYFLRNDGAPDKCK